MSAHDHSHSHDHAHGHSHVHGASERRAGLAAALTGAFMLVEVIGGWISGSLALLADAGHMLADFAALGLAWYGFRLARRPADWRRTYGYDRFSILVAFTNGLALFAIALWITVEAWHRLQAPPEIRSGVMFAVALAGLAVNLLAFRMLQGEHKDNLNMRAAALHVAGDLLGSVAALGTAVIIMITGWWPIDPILSVLVSVIILRSAWHVTRESAHILLEGTPGHLDPRTIAEDLTQHVPGVVDIHHIHAWSITQERPMLTLHARVTDPPPPAVVPAIKARLKQRFGVAHATVEVESGSCADAAHDHSHEMHR